VVAQLQLFTPRHRHHRQQAGPRIPVPEGGPQGLAAPIVPRQRQLQGLAHRFLVEQSELEAFALAQPAMGAGWIQPTRLLQAFEGHRP
jgi:hypothetical protein